MCLSYKHEKLRFSGWKPCYTGCTFFRQLPTISENTKCGGNCPLPLPPTPIMSSTGRHLKKLGQFHLRCFPRLANISREDRVSTSGPVLSRASLPDVEALIMKTQLRWTGHAMRMEDSRLPRSSALKWRMALAGRGPDQGYNDSLKNSLPACDITAVDWERLAADRSAFRSATHKVTQAFEKGRLLQLNVKR